MKSPKKPSKAPSLPSQDESRRTNVLMEQMLSKFNAFSESLTFVREDVISLKPRFDNLEQKADLLESAVRSQSADIRTIKADVAALKSDVTEIKTGLKDYNQRLEVVEAKLA